MASDLNRVVLIGRLVRDPEIKQTQNGKSFCKFSIANNRTYVVDGNKREDTSFINCVAFGRLSEIIQQYCQKGKQIAVEGRLTQRSWDSPEGKRSIVEVTVENMQLLGSAQGGGGNGGGYGSSGSGFSSGSGGGYNSGSQGNDSGYQDPPYMDQGPLPEDDDIPF
ncbi:MAG: single-stranded DNA-binding protein [Spirochaetaceae bacterium]|nr:single-stranded DNA-binding protein [Spirochaetaceae bacterium]|tara:strand:+ start:498 stop:992 length:495 start_codon:yes stop_codon:yes gene_type:complete